MAKKRVFTLTGGGLQNIDAFIKASELPDNALSKVLRKVAWKQHPVGKRVTPRTMERLFEKKRLPLNLWLGLVEKLPSLGITEGELTRLTSSSQTR